MKLLCKLCKVSAMNEWVFTICNCDTIKGVNSTMQKDAMSNMNQAPDSAMVVIKNCAENNCLWRWGLFKCMRFFCDDNHGVLSGIRNRKKNMVIVGINVDANTHRQAESLGSNSMIIHATRAAIDEPKVPDIMAIAV